MALALVATRSMLLLLVPWRELLLLTGLLRATIVVVAVVVGVAVASMSECICSDRDCSYCSRNLNGGLSVSKLLVNFGERWCKIATFNLISNGFVFLGQASKDKLNLILMIIWFTEECEMIKPNCESLEILINCFVALGPILNLLLDLFDMNPARLRICLR